MHHIPRRLTFSHSSLSKSNRAFVETSYLARGSNVWSRRRNSGVASSAVAASEDVSSKAAPKRSKKRVSKAERKSLIESFVNSYRAVNSGKFPTASEAKKEIGGCFYFARKVIQEMEYETRMSSTSLSRLSLKTEVNEKKEQLEVMNTMEKVKLPEAQVPLTGQEILGTELPMNDVSGVTIREGKEEAKKINLGSEKNPDSDCRRINEENEKSAHTSDFNDVPSVDAGEKPFTWDASVLEQNNFSHKNVMSSATDHKTDVITQKTDLSSEEPKVVPPTPEISEDMKEKIITIDDRQLESPKTEEPARDMSKEHVDNVESPKKSFAWNLKSLADSIINFWRKL